MFSGVFPSGAACVAALFGLVSAPLLNKQRKPHPKALRIFCAFFRLPSLRWRVDTRKYNTFGEYREPSVYGS